MKTLHTSAIALLLALVVSFSAQAQFNTQQLAHNQPVRTVGDYSVAAPAPAAHKTFDISLYRVQQSMTVRLSIEKVVGEKISITLLNAKGDAVYSESVGRKGNSYARRFDLSDLGEGSYTIEVRNGSEVIRRLVNLSTPKPVQNADCTIVALN